MYALLFTVNYREFQYRHPVSRVFLSLDAILRYVRLFGKYFPALRCDISPVMMNFQKTDIYVLTEDNHGEIGYYLDRDRAYEAARDVIMKNPYIETWNGHGYDSREITRDEITDQQIDDYDFCVGVERYNLNNAWCH